MSNNPFLANPAFGKLNEDAQKSVSQAFDAMETWRGQLTEMGEKNSDAVFDKMTEAAKSLGWPTEYLEMSRKQIQQASKMQVQIVDQMMGAWEKNVSALGNGAKAPTFPSMPTFPGFGMPGAGSSPFPGFGDMGAMSANPMQFWMQAAEAWQKNWQQAMSAWTDQQSSMMGGKPGPNSGKSGPLR